MQRKWSSIRQRHVLAAGSGGQRGQDLVAVVIEKVNRAVAHEEVAAAGVERPEVEEVAGLIERAGLEMTRLGRAAGAPDGSTRADFAEITDDRAESGVP